MGDICPAPAGFAVSENWFLYAASGANVGNREVYFMVLDGCMGGICSDSDLQIPFKIGPKIRATSWPVMDGVILTNVSTLRWDITTYRKVWKIFV